MGMADFSSADCAAIGIYIAIVMACGFWAGRGERDSEDYFLAGRSLPRHPIGLPLFLAQEVTGLWDALGLPKAHFTYLALVMFALGLAVMTAISLAGRAPDAQAIAPVTFQRADLGGADPWRRLGDARPQAVALVAVLAVFIAAFW